MSVQNSAERHCRNKHNQKLGTTEGNTADLMGIPDEKEF
ncbi:hypothetical protein SLEP1_g30146 [Rubroshorea leprosula]|uniref:Uncharacterized protein n=1 Tax=Rubroshorea leprosula TaxID=152421 RepID=A0AAV5K5X2_9ROSI|nr:hypothetical protein SLEP1_g30146 [Rubroshorea leprosula]